MEFRPCIDIHNGKIKQIVGGSLQDERNQAVENFVSSQDGAAFASYYKERDLKGGHIILLNPAGSEFYEATKRQALLALHEYPGGMQVGGGIMPENAEYFLKEGASHVIVTSYVFKDGRIHFQNLEKLYRVTGKERLVLDVSCRKKDGEYYVVTDRWQKFTEEKVTPQLLDTLAGYADEFLVHAVDVEGKASGIEKDLVKMLGTWQGIPVTYAGGVGSLEDIQKLKELGKGRVNVTIGSALDLFGGKLALEQVLSACRG